ncbi:hypothetical protein V1477_001608 [Vespula maculifrons]|uniref:Uncharacterized protein n=1 Tax=Vespula maculifrons TaxID=7453 RepID=A0ABD2CYB3_VESMC
MEESVKSKEQFPKKIQVCLQNLALRKLRRCTYVGNDRINSNVTVNTQDRINSNSKLSSLESNFNEFRTSKERVDLLQDFRPQDLQINIRSQCMEPRETIKKYVDRKENGHVTETKVLTNTKILSRNRRFSLPILRVESAEATSVAKISHQKDSDVTINGINRTISKKERSKEDFSLDDNNREVKRKENGETGDTTKLISQDISRIEETSRSSNPIIAEEQLTDSRDNLKRGSDVKHLMEDKRTIDESIEHTSKRTNEEHSFEGSTVDWKFSEACLSSEKKDCDIITTRFIVQIGHNAKNKEIPAYGKRHFHLNKKCLAKREHASSYLATSINENVKDNSFYQFIRHRCGKNMKYWIIRDTSTAVTFAELIEIRAFPVDTNVK